MIGTTISHYKIIEKLGSGGMGVIYKAEDTKLRRIVALKFLPPELTRDPKAKERFIHEAQAASSLDHINICTVHEIDETKDNRMFISMAHYDGGTLKEKIESAPLAMKEAIDIVSQIGQGLKKAHSSGIIHRDIKPANILITSDGVVKIVDFGLAKLAGQHKITRTGATLGTTAYMSPEQARGEEVDHKTDIWSLGVLMYEIVSAELPFRGEYDQAVVFSILNEEPESIPGMDSEYERIINNALAKNPQQRYQQVDEILRDLKSLRKKIKSELSQKQSKKKSVPSIAVLPFVNMSADPEQEYFCDGIAEELINALTKIENLHVPARTSAFVFKGQKVDIREIGRRLNVEHVLEGSVRKAGNRLRITSQLIKVDNGYHLWSERFDRELDDIFAIQDEIAMAIVDRLKVRLLGGKKDKLVKRYTEDLNAYSLYLKGRYYWNSITPEAWAKSYQCYQQAIATDPNYALAYVGLAIWHSSQMFWGDTHPRKAVAKSTEHLFKAIALDDTISDAHSGLGITFGFYEWNLQKAETEFQKSIELGPKNAFAHLNFALFLASRKSFDKALLHAKKVQQFDPLSSLTKCWAASVMTYAGQYEESVIHFQQIIDEDPRFWQPHYNLSVAYIYQGKYTDAILAADKAVHLSGGASVAKTFLGCAHALNGQREQAVEKLNELMKRNSEKYVPFTFFILLYNALQETDEAYHWLEKAVQDHDPWLSFYGIFPRSLHAGESRFDDLIKANGLVV